MRTGLSTFLLILILLALTPQPGYGQGELDTDDSAATPLNLSLLDYKFAHLTTEDGLSNNRATAIFQDSQGFMWFGTFDGLNRYDGYDFRTFRHDQNDPNSLSSNVIQTVYEDDRGMLWIGTIGGGISRFDPRTERFTNYRHDPDDPHSLGGNNVFEIYQDRNGIIWIGTGDGGLNQFDSENDAFVRYQHDPDDPATISSDAVRDILELGDGSFLIGTDGGGLNHFDLTSGTFVAYRHDPDDPESIGHDAVISMVEDENDALWLALWGGGLDRLDHDFSSSAPLRFVHFRHDPNDPDSLSNDNVFKVLEGANGSLWLGTLGGGLNRFDRQTEQFVAFRNSPDDPYSLNHNSVISMALDDSGLLWLGTSGGGVDRLDLDAKAFTHYRVIPDQPSPLNSKDVMGIVEDGNGILWIGTGSGGLNRLDRDREEVIFYTPDPADPNSLPAPMVREIAQDVAGNLWLATRSGVSRFDPQAAIFTTYKYDPEDPNGLLANNVMTVFADEDGAIWAGTWEGLNRIDPLTGEITNFANIPELAESLTGFTVLSIDEDDGGVLWIGTFGSGLIQFNPKENTLVHYRHDPADPASLINDTIWNVYHSSNGALWLGTAAGLERFDADRQVFEHFGGAEGLPPGGVMSILGDDLTTDAGGPNLWISSANGLTRFNPTTGDVRTYDASDGLQSNDFVWSSAFKSDDGELFFGGSNGMTGFNPAELVDNPHVPPVVLTNFELNNQPVSIGDDAVLQQATAFMDQLTLSYQDQVQSFEFAALDYRAPEKNHFRYKLEGFDDEWTEVDSQRRFVTYTNLDPGNYVLRVLGSNNDGVWNESGVSVDITISPPWWGTNLFRIGLIALVLAILAGVLLAQRWGSQRREQALETLVDERSHELEHAQDIISTIFEKSPLGIGFAGMDDRVLTANPALAHIFGYTQEEFLGLNVRELFRSEEARMEVAEDISDSKLLHRQMQQLRRKDGTRFYANLTESRVTTSNGDALLSVVDDITELIETENALHAEREEVALFEERSRIAADMHDSATQSLYSALLFNETGIGLFESGDSEGAAYYQKRVTELVYQALRELRLLVFQLRPLVVDSTDLIDNLRVRLDAVENRSGITAMLYANDLPDIPDEKVEELYWIAIEALNNSLKHAHGKTVAVTFASEAGTFVMQIVDDGQGFDLEVATSSGGLGLTTMRERAERIDGELTIDATEGVGTKIRLIVPLTARTDEDSPSGDIA